MAAWATAVYGKLTGQTTLAEAMRKQPQRQSTLEVVDKIHNLYQSIWRTTQQSNSPTRTDIPVDEMLRTCKTIILPLLQEAAQENPSVSVPNLFEIVTQKIQQQRTHKLRQLQLNHLKKCVAESGNLDLQRAFQDPAASGLQWEEMLGENRLASDKGRVVLSREIQFSLIANDRSIFDAHWREDMRKEYAAKACYPIVQEIIENNPDRLSDLQSMCVEHRADFHRICGTIEIDLRTPGSKNPTFAQVLDEVVTLGTDQKLVVAALMLSVIQNAPLEHFKPLERRVEHFEM